MPRLSQFFGIIITMYYDDHNPPHFHALYSGQEAEITIDPIGLLQGALPSRVRSMVYEWAALHQEELRQNWQHAVDHQPFGKIAPLE